MALVGKLFLRWFISDMSCTLGVFTDFSRNLVSNGVS